MMKKLNKWSKFKILNKSQRMERKRKKSKSQKILNKIRKLKMRRPVFQLSIKILIQNSCAAIIRLTKCLAPGLVERKNQRKRKRIRRKREIVAQIWI